MVLDKGKVISVKKRFVTVQIGKNEKKCEIRKDVKVRKGDKVVVAFGVIVDKL